MKTLFLSIPLWLTAPLFVALCLGCIRWTSFALIKHHETFIPTAWYFFFLFTCLTVAIGVLCAAFGAIDAKGSFVGPTGAALNSLLKVVFDLNGDICAAGGLVALVLVPQGLSYLFAGGLSGVAIAPRFANPAVRYALLSLSKSFVIAGGAFLGLGFVAWLSGWAGMDGRKMVGMLILAFALLMVAFYALVGYALTDPDFPTTAIELPRRLKAMHAFMTRRSRPSLDAPGSAR